ncbi:Apoptosis 1 inhibitor [Trachymyrmex zeteki]|uniref:Apoptosis 1 inhibitor n=1 Tax=Mycetomoellerius zeteki TaxID=64791 RepID=A0A151X3R6_9HYME|nr:PREDICTED: baculoviral IAP repeat-containing protein 7-B-like [Trachymyrmex zeteki]XP_018304327.1 PREDICTED: baculoviral IAP repeat-containing protein 7-B-like [Trachymyrmex zeteki]XP_018304329.1 PREDICTED: baculoviral IAP repeat-containing protein 7-B-like [Trachymyrmex zeteki]KYQ54910.1 Apoptosis 1 inhibitor [Trachymyrmex zeteki]
MKWYVRRTVDLTTCDETDYSDYRFEIVRLNSFAMWPVSTMDPKKLAAAGFFYTKKEDAVKCFECKIILSSWMDGDNPKVEHQRWSGRCKFIRDLPCGNVPIGTDPSTIPKVSKRVDTCGLYGVKYMPLSGPDNDLQIESAMNSDSTFTDLNDDIDITVFWDADTNAHVTAKLSDVLGSKQPTYASYERRLRSFAICTSDTICEKKEELAKAGFFYLSGLFEPSDQTMCFYCGKCLRAWEQTDDPVEEHIKWYPQCNFIKKILAKEQLKKKSELCAERTDHESETNPTDATTTV